MNSIRNESCEYFGPFHGLYFDVGEEIIDEKVLKLCDGKSIASLLYHSWQEKEVNESLRRWIWIGEVNVWTKRGVYVIKDEFCYGKDRPFIFPRIGQGFPEGEQIKGVFFNDDRSIRFAPKETYTLGEHTPETLCEDGYVIATCGVEGAAMLAEASKNFNGNPRTWGLDVQEKGTAKHGLTTLTSSGGLTLRGTFWGDRTGGYAFGRKI